MPLHVRLKGKTSTASRLNSKSSFSGGGIAGGKKSNKSEGAKGKGTRFAGENKGEKREECKERRGNEGMRRRRSDTKVQMDASRNVSDINRRKRKGAHDSWFGDENGAPSSESKLNKKSPSLVTRGKVSARKHDRLKSPSLEEDDLLPGKRRSSKIYGLSRGVKDQSVLDKNTNPSRGKGFGKSTKVNHQKDGATNADLGANVVESNKSDDPGQIIEENPRVRRTRVLDKSGKKIKVTKKDLVSDSEEVTPVKKRKRMKLDPYDTSNKRLDDSTSNQDVSKAEKIPDKSPTEDTEPSINAKFRAIQPSSSILSYVEDSLLGRRRLNEIKNAGYNVKLSAPLDNVPFSTSTERERIGESVFRNKLEFFAAAKISSSFPPTTIPEIAFAGVSNVGKSSLLNALTRQWGVVRTSDKPGLTQTINFFRLASKLCLVDLPGYGFAYAKDEVKESWQELVKEYVSTRVGLERVCLLVHTKRGMKPLDYELVDLMERSKTPYQIVLTKTDLVFPIDVARRAMQIQESLKKKKSVINPVMMVSSKTGAGVGKLRAVLGKLGRFIKP